MAFDDEFVPIMDDGDEGMPQGAPAVDGAAGEAPADAPSGGDERDGWRAAIDADEADAYHEMRGAERKSDMMSSLWHRLFPNLGFDLIPLANYVRVPDPGEGDEATRQGGAADGDPDLAGLVDMAAEATDAAGEAAAGGLAGAISMMGRRGPRRSDTSDGSVTLMGNDALSELLSRAHGDGDGDGGDGRPEITRMGRVARLLPRRKAAGAPRQAHADALPDELSSLYAEAKEALDAVGQDAEGAGAQAPAGAAAGGRHAARPAGDAPEDREASRIAEEERAREEWAAIEKEIHAAEESVSAGFDALASLSEIPVTDAEMEGLDDGHAADAGDDALSAALDDWQEERRSGIADEDIADMGAPNAAGFDSDAMGGATPAGGRHGEAPADDRGPDGDGTGRAGGDAGEPAPDEADAPGDRADGGDGDDGDDVDGAGRGMPAALAAIASALGRVGGMLRRGAGGMAAGDGPSGEVTPVGEPLADAGEDGAADGRKILDDDLSDLDEPVDAPHGMGDGWDPDDLVDDAGWSDGGAGFADALVDDGGDALVIILDDEGQGVRQVRPADDGASPVIDEGDIDGLDLSVEALLDEDDGQLALADDLGGIVPRHDAAPEAGSAPEPTGSLSADEGIVMPARQPHAAAPSGGRVGALRIATAHELMVALPADRRGHVTTSVAMRPAMVSAPRRRGSSTQVMLSVRPSRADLSKIDLLMPDTGYDLDPSPMGTRLREDFSPRYDEVRRIGDIG